MKDQEIRELVKDLESVGLSDDPSTIEVGRDGVTNIGYAGNDSDVEIIFLLKRSSYESISLWNNHCYFVSQRNSYTIVCDSEESAKRVAKKIQTFLNS
jgi:hypothetical protein